MTVPALKTVTTILVAITAVLYTVLPDQEWAGLRESSFVQSWKQKRAARVKRAPVDLSLNARGMACASPPLGKVSSLFQAYVKEDWVGDKDGGIISGRLATGGSSTLTNWTVGRTLFPQPQSCFDLDATSSIYPYAITSYGTFSMRRGDVQNGHVASASSDSFIGSDVVSKMQTRACHFKAGVSFESFGVDLRDANREVEDVSGAVRGMEATVRVVLNAKIKGKVGLLLDGKKRTEVVHVPVHVLEEATTLDTHARSIQPLSFRQHNTNQ
ncbi:hypothetical protein HK104_001139 [Borealophlyctis nickersoniae]|nr:hypothetical protein HK104_001139 [Borealophlyctis nickersoniae]